MVAPTAAGCAALRTSAEPASVLPSRTPSTPAEPNTVHYTLRARPERSGHLRQPEEAAREADEGLAVNLLGHVGCLDGIVLLLGRRQREQGLLALHVRNEASAHQVSKREPH